MAWVASQDRSMSFDEFYQKYYNHAFKIAWITTGERQSAEDAVQQAFLELFDKYRNGLRLEDAARLISRVVTFRAIDQQRTKGRQPVPLDPIALINLVDNQISDDDLYDGSLEREELASLMRGWIDGLCPKHKQVIMMSYYDGMTDNEIAAALASPIGSIKTWLHRSKRNLRKKIIEDKKSSEYIGEREKNAGTR